MKKLESWCQKAQELRSKGTPLEQVLEYLRRDGASIVDSIKVVRVVEGIRLGQAKEILDQSKTWADGKEANNAIRSTAEQALDTNEPG